ncbi:4-hydroxy-tetrahydrodipicolinate reductase [Flavobacteriaceae bacterium GF1]
MNIALFGYGKMGKMLEKLGTDRGHSFPLKIEFDTNLQSLNLSAIDVAIDFSTPDAAFNNIKYCFENGVPVISGTTGWLDAYDEAVSICNALQGAFIYASNFSLGVNIFFELNAKLAKMMSQRNDYGVVMEEIHHIHKLDAPSGTAITLAEGIVRHSDYKGWQLGKSQGNTIPISAKREGEVPGTHSITYSSKVDSIEIKHTAHNREGFALGALIAAEWIQGKKGVFTMKDVLNLV